MPFNLFSVDLGGNRVKAASQIGSRIAEALARNDEEKKKREFNSGVFEMMKDRKDRNGEPFIPVAAIARWESLSPDKQAGFLSSAGARMQEDQRLGELAMRLLGPDRPPSPYANTKIWNDKGEEVGVYDEKGSPHFYPGRRQTESESNFEPRVITLTDPATNKPFSVYTRGPNQVNLTPGSETSHPMAGQPVVNAETGDAVGIYDAKGNPRYWPRQPAVDPEKQAIAELIMGKKPQPQPSATPRTTPTPTPTAAPTATPAAAGSITLSEREYAAMRRAVALQEDQEALAWARANPQDSRAAAILKRLGMSKEINDDDAAPRFVKGQRVKQNGVIYEFDGSSQWNPVLDDDDLWQ